MKPRTNTVIALAVLAAFALPAMGCSATAPMLTMQTADEVVAALDERGFDSNEAEACYSEDGSYIDGVKISQGAEGAHPYYSLYHTDSSGDVWVVYDMGGQITARLFGTNTWLSERDFIADYDARANEFYSLQSGDGLKVIQVDRVSAETLDAFKVEQNAESV